MCSRPTSGSTREPRPHPAQPGLEALGSTEGSGLSRCRANRSAAHLQGTRIPGPRRPGHPNSEQETDSEALRDPLHVKQLINWGPRLAIHCPPQTPDSP